MRFTTIGDGTVSDNYRRRLQVGAAGLSIMLLTIFLGQLLTGLHR